MLVGDPEQEVIKEVIKNEIENPENGGITQKNILLADRINENLTNNSAFIIENENLTNELIAKTIMTGEKQPIDSNFLSIEKEAKQSIPANQSIFLFFQWACSNLHYLILLF